MCCNVRRFIRERISKHDRSARSARTNCPWITAISQRISHSWISINTNPGHSPFWNNQMCSLHDAVLIPNLSHAVWDYFFILKAELTVSEVSLPDWWRLLHLRPRMVIWTQTRLIYDNLPQVGLSRIKRFSLGLFTPWGGDVHHCLRKKTHSAVWNVY